MAEVTEEQHARAMLRGAWQCPACALGWMKYDIARDLNLCPSCGYHGGEVVPKCPLIDSASCAQNPRFDPG